MWGNNPQEGLLFQDGQTYNRCLVCGLDQHSKLTIWKIRMTRLCSLIKSIDLLKCQSTSRCWRADKGVASQCQCAVGFIGSEADYNSKLISVALGIFQSNSCMLNMTGFGSGFRFCVWCKKNHAWMGMTPHISDQLFK